MSLERVWKISKLTPNSFLFSPKKRWDIKKIWAWSEFGESLENLQTHSKLIPLFQRNNEITKNTENIWVWLQTHKEIFAWCHFSKTKTKKGKMSLENLQNLSKLKKICVHNFFLSGCTHICFEKNCGRIFFWVWREFGDSPNSFFHLFWKKHFFWKMTSSKDFFVNLEWVWSQTHMFSFFCFIFFYFMFVFLKKRNEFGVNVEILQTDSKFGPNSYVFMFFLFYFFFGKEEWVWSECGDSPNSLQTRSKLKWFHVLLCFPFIVFFIFVWKRQTILEWAWGFSKLSPNSPQIRSKLICFQIFLFFCSFLFILLFWEKGNEFGVGLGVLQTHPKLKSFLFCSVCFPFIVILNIFWEERNENGVSLEVLQTLSKLTPNSLQTHMVSFCCFFFIVNLFFIFWKRNEFHSFRYLYWIVFKKKEWIWRFPKVSPISLRALVATPLGPEIRYSGRCFIGTYQINLVHAYHPEQLSSCKLSIYIIRYNKKITKNKT